MLSRLVLGSLVITSAAHAQPAETPPIETTSRPDAESESEVEDSVETGGDDLLFAPGLRPIRGKRIEALTSLGTNGTANGAARLTTKHGAIGLELDGAIRDSDRYIRSQHDAGARVEHTTDGSHARAYGRFTDEARDTTEHQNTDARTTSYGGRWTVTRPSLRLDLEAFGEQQRLRDEYAKTLHTMPWSRHGLRGSIKSRPVTLLGMEHTFLVGTGMVRAASSATEELGLGAMMKTDNTIRSRRVRGDHRFLDAYIEDTVRFIRSLDISAGFVVERWRNLGGDSTITYGTGDEMDVDVPDVSTLLVSPTLGATYRLNDDIALRARSFRGMRTPTLTELYRPGSTGGAQTAANQGLRPETVWTTHVGPEVSIGRITASASAFYSQIDNAIGSVTLPDATRQQQNFGSARVIGVETEASVRPAKAWLATMRYTFASSTVTDSAMNPQLVGKQLSQAPRQRASALLTYDQPRLATITGAVRYVDRQYADDLNTQQLGRYVLVDAIAARKLTGGLSGFVAVDNLFDRRYLVGRTGIDTLGAPRTFHIGVRLDTKRF